MAVQLEDIEMYGPDSQESVKINGPPGTGKTTTAAARVARLVEEHDVNLDEVVWVTYRRSLAEETLQRFEEWGIISEDELDEPHQGRTRWIGTTHAVANRLAGTKLSGGYVSESDKWDFFDEKYNVPYDPDNRASQGKVAMSVLHWLRNNEVHPSNPYQAQGYSELQSVWPNHPPMTELARDWDAYKEDNKINDFYQVLDAAYESSGYPGSGVTPKIVVADEYHDVYPKMDKLLRKWLNAADTAIVAGDPKQVVNAHEGSSPEYFERLTLDEVSLPKSRRVPQEHWEAARTMLSMSHDAPDIEVSEGGDIFRNYSPTFEHDNRTDEWTVPVDEMYSPRWVVENRDGSVLFLTRTRKQAAGVGKSLQRSGILYTSQDGAGGWDNTDKRKNLYNALQKVSEAEIYSKWDKNDDETDVTLTGDEASRLIQHSKLEYLDVADREEADEKSFHLSQISEVELSSGIGHLLEDEWEDVYTNLRAPQELTEVTFEERKTIAAALYRYDSTVEELMGGDSEYDCVQVLTIHGSKGYEAQNVVVYDGITSKIRDSINSSRMMRANEHRTWYVALTRAKESLLILDDAFGWTTSFVPDRIGRGMEVDT